MVAKIIDDKIEIKDEITALDIAHALYKHGGKLITPTSEQRAIIESRHFGPTVIVAGAGKVQLFKWE